MRYFAAVAAAAFVGSQFSPDPWYAALKKPSFNPPNAVFPIVWTTLYAAMGYSAYRAAKRNGKTRWWWTQLALNAAWSPLFFGAHRPDLALADLGALLLALSLYTRDAAKVDRPAAALMVPYLAWVSFAGLLNAEIARLND